MPRLCCLLVIAIVGTAHAADPGIIIAVYEGAGTSNSRAELLKALAGRSDFKVKSITAEDIRAGKLADCDVLIQPGGSGSKQAEAIGPAGRKNIQDFVRGGKGYVGICAGAYLASRDYSWSLNILDAKVIDKKHWNRGHGPVEVSFTPKAKQLLGVKADSATFEYYQGPLLAPGDDPAIPDFDLLGSFNGEVTKDGVPKGVMKGTSAIAAGTFGKGRVFCFSPHPEKTPALHPVLHRAILWAAQHGAEDDGGR